MRLKALSLLSLFCLLYGVSALALKSSAPYVGAGVGYNIFHSDVRLSGSNANGPPPDTGTMVLPVNKTFPNVNLFAGYRHNICADKYFLGGELFVTPLADTMKKVDIDALLSDNIGVAVVPVYQNIQLKLVRQFSTGVTFVGGRYFDDQTAAFVSISALGSRFRITHGDDSPQSTSKNKFVFGFAPGVGVKHYIMPRLPLTFQYSYQIYNTFSTGNMNTVDAGSIEYKFKNNRYHNVLLSLAWEI